MREFWSREVTYSLVVADGVDLRSKHHRCENEKEQTLETQEDEEDDRRRRREVTALWRDDTRPEWATRLNVARITIWSLLTRPVFLDTEDKMKGHHD